MLQIPVFHVNGEDPEAVAQVVDLAVDFRQRFHRDVVIEMWCYRKLGHNEGDEPAFTQPVMYRAIARKPSIRTAYLATTSPTLRRAANANHRRGRRRDRRREAPRAGGGAGRRDQAQTPPRPSTFAGAWARIKGGPDAAVPDVPTAVSARSPRPRGDAR